MKYVRVVLAVREEDVDEFDLELDEFIEGCDFVHGAYVSQPYNTREEGTGRDWVGK